MRLFLCFLLCLSCCLPAAGADDKLAVRVDELAGGLGGKSWEMREKAQDDLLLLFVEKGEGVASLVAEHFVKAADPEVKARLNAILRRMAPEYIRLGKRGFLGVSLGRSGELVKVGDTVYDPVDIMGVMPASVAKYAGFAGGERILSMDDIKCTGEVGVEDAVRYISSRGPGGLIKLVLLLKDKKVVARTIKLGERPRMDGEPEAEEISRIMFEEWLKTEIRRATERVKDQ